MAALHGNEEAVQVYCGQFVRGILAAIKSPVAASGASELFLSLQKCVLKNNFSNLGS